VEDSTHEFLFPTPFSEGALSFFSMLANYLWILGVVFLITAGMRFLIVYIYCKKHNSNQDKFLIKTSKIFKRIIASAIILIGLAFLVYIGFKIHFYRATPENPPGPILVLGEVLMNYALGIPLMLAVTFLIYWISVENA
jgi:heme/copper-type cytochrome/quinol oxidase subunit 2